MEKLNILIFIFYLSWVYQKIHDLFLEKLQFLANYISKVVEAAGGDKTKDETTGKIRFIF